MTSRYGDYRDTQKRAMHRAAPQLPEGFESRIFAEDEDHDEAQGWTHSVTDAIAAGQGVAPETATLEAQLAALKRPALLKLASEQGVTYEMGWTAAQLRTAIMNHQGGLMWRLSARL